MTTKTLQWTKTGTSILNESGKSIALVADTDIMSIAEHWSDDFADSTLIVPCGPHAGIDPEPSADLLAQWSQDSWEPFNAQVLAANQLAKDSNTKLVILPGVGGRLSDAICTVSWANTHKKNGLLIDPAGWLTPSMMTDLNDHLIRFVSMCLEIPNIWGVVIRSIQEDEAGHLVHAPLGEGLISEELLDRTIRTIPTPRLIECK